MKYKLTDKFVVNVFGVKLFQVQYIKTGELGGYIEKESNLSQEGNALVSGNARVSQINHCINVINLKFNITLLPEDIQIGCMLRPISKWLKTKYESVKGEVTKEEFDNIKTVIKALIKARGEI